MQSCKKFIFEGKEINFMDKNNLEENTILFIHGNSHSLRSFYEQMEFENLQGYRLVFIDLPGHGDSSALEQYSLKYFSSIVNALIVYLGLKSLIIVGHSLGGHVAINTLKIGAHPKGLFLFGTPPIKNPFDPSGFLPNLKGLTLSKMNPEYKEIIELLEELKYSGENKTIALEDFIKTDAKFREKIFEDIVNGMHEDEVSIIEEFTTKIVFLLSSEETLINNNYIKECFVYNESVKIKEVKAGHSPHIEISEEFNEHLLELCKEAF